MSPFGKTEKVVGLFATGIKGVSRKKVPGLGDVKMQAIEGVTIPSRIH